MDVKEAITKAKAYVADLYEDEPVTNLGLEEIEHFPASNQWAVTLAFSRPWNTPKSRAQEVMESLGGVSALKRSFKVLTLDDDGTVVSMKNRSRTDMVE